MTVRKAAKADLTQIFDLYKEFVDCAQDEYRAKMFEAIDKDSRYLLAVAWEEGQVAGTAMGVICNDLCGPGPFMVIENVVVDAGYQGRAVGQQIFDYLHQWAEGAGCYYAILVSSAHREGAHAFYRKMGYTEEKGFRRYFSKEEM